MLGLSAKTPSGVGGDWSGFTLHGGGLPGSAWGVTGKVKKLAEKDSPVSSIAKPDHAGRCSVSWKVDVKP